MCATSSYFPTYIFVRMIFLFSCSTTHIEQLFLAYGNLLRPSLGHTNYIGQFSYLYLAYQNILISLGNIKTFIFHCKQGVIRRYGDNSSIWVIFIIHSQICKVQCIWKFNTIIKYLNFSHKYLVFMKYVEFNA